MPRPLLDVWERYYERLASLPRSMNMMYEGTATMSRPTANMTPSRTYTIFPFTRRAMAFSGEADTVRVKKTRQHKDLKPGSDSIRTEKAFRCAL